MNVICDHERSVGWMHLEPLTSALVGLELKAPGGDHELSLDRLNLYATPEGNSALDLVGRWTRVRVVPGGVFVRVVTNDHVVIAGHTLPVASRVSFSWAQILPTDIGQGKVLIALDGHGVGAFRQDGVVPGRTVPPVGGLCGRWREDPTQEFHEFNLRQ